MPSTTITHDLTNSFSSGGDFCDEFKVSHKTEVSTRRGKTAVITLVKNFNPTNEFSFKGGGDPAVAVGSSGGVTFSEVTGGVMMVEKYDHTGKNNDFDEYESSGTHYPGATAAS